MMIIMTVDKFPFLLDFRQDLKSTSFHFFCSFVRGDASTQISIMSVDGARLLNTQHVTCDMLYHGERRMASDLGMSRSLTSDT